MGTKNIWGKYFFIILKLNMMLPDTGGGLLKDKWSSWPIFSTWSFPGFFVDKIILKNKTKIQQFWIFKQNLENKTKKN